jgi:hypothetical protein
LQKALVFAARFGKIDAVLLLLDLGATDISAALRLFRRLNHLRHAQDIDDMEEFLIELGERW